jgi:ATP-dependent DNA helicase RecQ
LLEETQDGYSVLSLNARSWEVLRNERVVQIAGAPKAARVGAPIAADPRMPDGGALFERLRALRKRLADEHGVPPYVIFHDATLRHMVTSRPVTLSQFAALPGVGQAKLARYGEEFIAALRGDQA